MRLNEIYGEFDKEMNFYHGSTKDFLESINAGPKELKAAFAELKTTPEWKKITDKMDFVSTPTLMKNGTLQFDQKIKADRDYNYKYLIHATGQIRQTAGTGEFRDTVHRTRLKSLKPRVTVDNPVKSLVTIYKAAIKEVLAKFAKKEKKNAA